MMAIVPGEKAAHKRLDPTAANLPPLSLAAAVTAAAAAVESRASFCFLSLVAGDATTWILVKDGGKGAFRAGDQCVEQLRWLPALKIEKKKKNLFAKAVDHVLVMNLTRKDWIECSLQLNWILNFPHSRIIMDWLTSDCKNKDHFPKISEGVHLDRKIYSCRPLPGLNKCSIFACNWKAWGHFA